jgi:hypothetical protein
MSIEIDKIQTALCNMFCAEIKLHKKNDNLIIIDTPFNFSDGDPYQIYLKLMPGGIYRLSDQGHTMLHLSYENDIDKFQEGTRGNIFTQILAEKDISYNNGEFYIDTAVENMVSTIFRFGQGLTKINDLTFLNRFRAESTFYDDLFEQIKKIIPGEITVEKDYVNTLLDNAKDYPIDYYIHSEARTTPLYLFGIPSKDKARLTTIVLERLLRNSINFDSILVFSDQGSIPRPDVARLSNAGGEMVASLDAYDDLSRKVLRKVA